MPLLPKYGSSEPKKIQVRSSDDDEDRSPLRDMAERSLARGSRPEQKPLEQKKKGFFASLFGKKE
ncbi:MAG: hypothetical protein NT067_03640 [Candidatus Diapherotrites archaeon]|nr:hypothetical protein [Candidatus Diapherotrites archaeon]